MSEHSGNANRRNAIRRVLLDTNIYCQDFQLRTSAMGLLLDESKHGRAQLLVPTVVFQETTRRFAEEARKRRQSIVQLERALRRFGIDKHVLDGLKVALDDRISSYPSFFRSTLEGHSARFLDLPNVSHQKILDRVLARRKPISEDGKRGYQDTLIWETLLSLRPSKEDMIYFITNNSNDFADRAASNVLSPDLLNELLEYFGDSSGVVLLPNLKDFTDIYIKPDRELVVSGAATVPASMQQPEGISTQELSLVLEDFFAGYAEEIVGTSPDQIIGGDADFDKAYIEESDFEQVQIGETFRISEEEIGVSCEAEFRAAILMTSGTGLAGLRPLFELIPWAEYSLPYKVARYEGQLYVEMEVAIDQAELKVIEGTPSYAWVEIRGLRTIEDPNQGKLWESENQDQRTLWDP